ncbi:MAG: alpha/beta hydrolase [Opitutaceae bacterium]|jgi:acetyl esterase/lipase|nr:alpha/beta hydrolase [Opitutaceae bacterium]
MPTLPAVLRRTFLFVALCAPGLAPAAPTLASLLAAPAPEERVYRRIADRELRLFVFAPPASAAANAAAASAVRPAVVFFHGGAWRGGSPEVFFPHARYFATRGLVAISVEYRLVTPQVLGVADCVDDARAALRFVRAHAASLGVDPARIAAGGDSAGGHLASCLATVPGGDSASRPDALLLYNPVLDLTVGDWVRFVLGGARLDLKGAAQPPASPAELARAAALSPVLHVATGLPPTLLVQGTDDKVTPPVHAERFAAAAREAGARCELQLLSATGHAFVVPRYKAPESVVAEAIRSADRFLASLGWVSGEPTLALSEPPAWTPRQP